MQYKRACILLVFCCFLLPGCGKQRELDRIVCTINDEQILESELESNAKLAKLRARSELTALPDRAALLNALIERKIVLQESKRRGLTLSEEEFKVEIVRTGGYFSSLEFKDTLKNIGVSKHEWEKSMKEQLLFEKTVHASLEKVEVSDLEVQSYYKAHISEFARGEVARAFQIVSENRATIDNIKKELDRGADFKAMARGRSISPDSENDGDMGYFSREDMLPEIAGAVFNTEIGKMSGIIKTAYGYHLFLVVDRKKKGTLSAAEAGAEIKEKMKTSKAKKYFEKWLKELASKTVVKFNEKYTEEFK
ncbi:MAG: peptidyl-prolyl cis-trans isomerase [Candidatus Firestonebacteria bacterium]